MREEPARQTAPWLQRPNGALQRSIETPRCLRRSRCDGLACEDAKVDAATSGSLAVNASSSATGTAATSLEVGFALKAIAILLQIVEIVDRSAPQLSEARSRALRGLVQCYTALGLAAEADGARRLLN